MNAKIIAAISELESSQVVDPEGFQHGFIVEEVREDARDCGEWFYPTLAEAKRAFSRVELSSESERVAIYEGEFQVDWSRCDEPIKARWAVLIETRQADPREVVWTQADYDSWSRKNQEASRDYWQIRDWLSGHTPTPGWAEAS